MIDLNRLFSIAECNPVRCLEEIKKIRERPPCLHVTVWDALGLLEAWCKKSPQCRSHTGDLA